MATGYVSKQRDDTRVSNLKLMYDVHLPNSRFKKTNPGCPAFSLCITRFGEILFLPAPTFSMQNLFTLYLLGLNVICDFVSAQQSATLSRSSASLGELL